MRYAVILATNQSEEMNSAVHKLMHPLCDTPMIGHLIEHLQKSQLDELYLELNGQYDEMKDYLEDGIHLVVQPQQKSVEGLYQIVKDLNPQGKMLVLSGDVPLVQPETIERLFSESETVDGSILVTQRSGTTSDGKVVRDMYGHVCQIIAEYDEKVTQEVSTGVYCFTNQVLQEYLPKLIENQLDLIDLIEYLAQDQKNLKAIFIPDSVEVLKIVDRTHLALASTYLQQKINERFMLQGVTLINPSQTYLSHECEIGQDTIIYPNVHVKGKSKIGRNVVIKPSSWIENSIIEDETIIDSSMIVNSHVKNNCTVGPNSHLRMNSVVEEKCRIGNYVEFKNVHFGRLSRCAHLTYLGDCEVGEDVNIGCGVVTVNYDGANKHKTIIKDHAFVGSNSNLVAPITVGEYAVVAAGSTVSKEVLDDEMIIERSQPIHKPGYGKAYITKGKREKK